MLPLRISESGDIRGQVELPTFDAGRHQNRHQGHTKLGRANSCFHLQPGRVGPVSYSDKPKPDRYPGSKRAWTVLRESGIEFG